MNIFNKVALQGLKKNRTRTLVTIIGVALAAAMLTAVITLVVSLQNYMVEGAEGKYGSWHVCFENVDFSFGQEQALDPQVESSASYKNIGYAALEDGQNPDKPYLFLAGFNNKTFDEIPVNLISGRLPTNSSEVIVPAHVASNGGVELSVGDTLTLEVGTRVNGEKILSKGDGYSPEESLVSAENLSCTVGGVYQRASFEEYTAPGYTLITLADSADTQGSFSTFITLKNPHQIRTFAEGVSEDGAYILNDKVLRFMGLSNDRVWNMFLYTVGGILIALIMVGAIFLIYNSLAMSLNDRMRQFGILLSVGATERQLQSSVLFEGLCIGAVGIPLGMLIGVPGIGIVLKLTSGNFERVMYDNVSLTLCISAPALVLAAAVSLVTILISAYIPARRAAHTPVMECIRQTNEVRMEAKAAKTSRLAERIGGLEGMLAAKNFKRNRKRYRSIVMSLTLSVVLFVSASSFGLYLKQAAENSTVDCDYDICFYTQDMSEDEVFALCEQLKTADGVTDSSRQAIMTYSCAVNASELSDRYRDVAGYDSLDETIDMSMNVQFIEDEEFLDFLESLNLPSGEYTGKNAKLLAVGKVRGQDELYDMFAGRSANLSLVSGTGAGANSVQKNADITFMDTIPLDTLPIDSAAPESCTFMIVAPYERKEEFEASGAETMLGVTFHSDNPSRSADEMRKMLQDEGITAPYTLYNVNGMMEDNRNILFIVDLFCGVFTVMISLVAVANVFNTISTNIRLRRRELAMLRSVGMSNRSFDKMMRFECLLYGLRTLVLGILIALGVSWLIYRGFGSTEAELSFVFPGESIAVSVIAVFLVIFLTMMCVVGKIKKENIIDTLRDEMT